MKWQPIETAPRDGTMIDVWLENADEADQEFYGCGTKRSTFWHWKEGKFRPYTALNFVICFVEPTHWMPIPGGPDGPL